MKFHSKSLHLRPFTSGYVRFAAIAVQIPLPTFLKFEV